MQPRKTSEIKQLGSNSHDKAQNVASAIVELAKRLKVIKAGGGDFPQSFDQEPLKKVMKALGWTGDVDSYGVGYAKNAALAILASEHQGLSGFDFMFKFINSLSLSDRQTLVQIESLSVNNVDQKIKDDFTELKDITIFLHCIYVGQFPHYFNNAVYSKQNYYIEPEIIHSSVGGVSCFPLCFTVFNETGKLLFCNNKEEIKNIFNSIQKKLIEYHYPVSIILTIPDFDDIAVGYIKDKLSDEKRWCIGDANFQPIYPGSSVGPRVLSIFEWIAEDNIDKLASSIFDALGGERYSDREIAAFFHVVQENERHFQSNYLMNSSQKKVFVEQFFDKHHSLSAMKLYELATCFAIGYPVATSVSLSRAVVLCARAAKQGYEKAVKKLPDFLDKLGMAYASGWGEVQDFIKAKKCFEKAAEKGHASAQYNLADYHHYSDGLVSSNKEDLVKAEAWYRKAAEQKYFKAISDLPHIQYDLTMAYAKDSSFKEAKESLQRAKQSLSHVSYKGNVHTFYKDNLETEEKLIEILGSQSEKLLINRTRDILQFLSDLRISYEWHSKGMGM